MVHIWERTDPKGAEKRKSHKVSGNNQDRIYKNVLNWSSKHGGNNQDEIILFSKCVEVQLFLVFLFGKLLLYFGQVTKLSHPQLASHKLTSQGKLLNHISLGKSLFVPHQKKESHKLYLTHSLFRVTLYLSPPWVKQVLHVTHLLGASHKLILPMTGESLIVSHPLRENTKCNSSQRANHSIISPLLLSK